MINKKPEWINEEEAAAMAGLKPKTFRRYVKSGTLAVAYTQLTRESAVFYDKVSIERLLIEKSSGTMYSK